ncbi:MAG TPA: FG-GAP-like repeat-containing protein, partial [Pyrinomonadaceae bacterium]|nr:FG-GAP-like repeat-containing protein [Pyrinomonadaceae bacterium]
AHALTLVDLDKDGRLDIITGKRYLAHDIDPGAYEPLGLYWYRLGEDGRYTKHVIDYNSKAGGGMQLPVTDIDGDGDLDIVAPGKSGLFLFEQVDFARQKAR